LVDDISTRIMLKHIQYWMIC